MKTIEIYQAGLEQPVGHVQVDDTATVDEIIALVNNTVGKHNWTFTQEIKT